MGLSSVDSGFRDLDIHRRIWMVDDATIYFRDLQISITSDNDGNMDFYADSYFVFHTGAIGPDLSVFTDVPDYSASADTYLRVNGTGTALTWAAATGNGATDWVSLSDTPGTVTANQFVVGNSDANALVFQQYIDLTSDVTGDLPLAEGGTGATLADPGADTLLGWDDGNTTMEWITVSTGLDLTANVLTATGGGGTWVSLTDTNAAIDANQFVVGNSDGNGLIFQQYVLVSDISFDADIIPTSTGFDLGSPTYEFTHLYQSTSGYHYLSDDQQEYIYSNGSYTMFGTQGVDRWWIHNDGHFNPNTADSYNVGSPDKEVANLYLGTGRMYLFTDQNASVRSTDGTNIIFGVSGTDELVLTSASVRPNANGGLHLGMTDYRYDDGFINTLTLSNPLSLASGGTGESLSDPAADRLLYWDDGNNAIEWLIVGDGLTVYANSTIEATASGSTWTSLSDTPGSIDANYYVKGAANGTALIMVAASAGGNDMSQYFPVANPDSYIGTHPAVLMPDDFESIVRQGFMIPKDITTITTASILVVAEAAGDLDYEITTNWGNKGGSQDYDNDSDTTSGQKTMAADDIEVIDFSAALTGATGGDVIGLEFLRDGDHDAEDTLNVAAYYLGIYIEGT